MLEITCEQCNGTGGEGRCALCCGTGLVCVQPARDWDAEEAELLAKLDALRAERALADGNNNP